MYEYMNCVRGTATSREKAVLYLEVSENLALQNTIAHLSQLQLWFRRCRICVSVIRIFCFSLQVIVIDGYLKVTPCLSPRPLFFSPLSPRSAQGLYRQLGKACQMPPLPSLRLEVLTPIPL
jgi:hypothetical protein